MADDVQLILSFGPVESPSIEWFDEVKHHWSTAPDVYCSGGGQITDGVVQDDDVVLTTVHFDGAAVHPVVRGGVDVANSTDAGEGIGAEVAKVWGLRHMLVFAEGCALDAASFVAGMNTVLPADVQVTGGLASNGIALSSTSVGLNGQPESGRVVGVGLPDAEVLHDNELFTRERRRLDTQIMYHAVELDHVQAVIVHVRDVTAQRASERAQRDSDARFRAFFDSAGFAIHVLTFDGVIVEANPASRTLLGYDVDELVGRQANMLSPDEDVANSQSWCVNCAPVCGTPSRSSAATFTKTGIWCGGSLPCRRCSTATARA